MEGGLAYSPRTGQGQSRTRPPDPMDRLSKKAAPGKAGSSSFVLSSLSCQRLLE